MVGRLIASHGPSASAASFLPRLTYGSHEEDWIKFFQVIRFSNIFSDLGPNPFCGTRVSDLRAQAHIRLPMMSAAPSFRILRTGFGRTGPFLTSACEAIPYAGSSPGSAGTDRVPVETVSASGSVVSWFSFWPPSITMPLNELPQSDKQFPG